MEECSCTAETSNPWPYRLKLTTYSMRWDSLKISRSKEFEEQVLENMPEATYRALAVWEPVEVSAHDVDTHETYKVNLAKKELFWFEPLPDIPAAAATNVSETEQSCHELHGAARKYYAYALQPFRNIIKKRNLGCDQEIGLGWSGGKTVNKMDFSAVHRARLELHNLKSPFAIKREH